MKILMTIMKIFIMAVVITVILGLGCLMMFGGFIIDIIVDGIVGLLLLIAIGSIIASIIKGNDKE